MSESSVLPLELRQVGNDHVLEGLCVPYNRISLKTGWPRGERFAPGAFAGAIKPGVKIRLTDSHAEGEKRRPVGVATEVRESREGLYGTFRFYDTPEGRGAWENVIEDTYGGLSIGFETLQDRRAPGGVREVIKARLHHVALVDEPAYDQAKIVAVRAAVPGWSELIAVQYDLGDFPYVEDIASLFPS